MKRLRVLLCVFLFRVIVFLMKLLGRNASYLPGWIIRKLYPDILGALSLPRPTICITGTNGKTTCTNLAVSALNELGYQVLHNSYGSNTVDGIATAVLKSVDWKGVSRDTIAVLELDELSARRVFPNLKPEYLIVTNLFRDSYYRNAHADFIASVLEEHIPPETKLILNAEDLISGALKAANPRVYFSIDPKAPLPQGAPGVVCDVGNCPSCGHALHCDVLRYNHLGHYHCPHCGFSNPSAQFVLETIDEEGDFLRIAERGERYDYHRIGTNITDWYNSLAVIALLRELAVPREKIAAIWPGLHIVKSRFDRCWIGELQLSIILAKARNPIASSRVFDYVRRQKGRKAVLMTNTHMQPDGLNIENTAWFYEIDAEFLVGDDIVQLIVAARRCYDYKVRLLLAGVDPRKISLFETLDVPAEALRLGEIDHLFLIHGIKNVPEAKAMLDKISALSGKEIRYDD